MISLVILLLTIFTFLPFKKGPKGLALRSQNFIFIYNLKDLY